MPKVGKKHFAYTKAGKSAASAEAKRTGNEVENAYAKGGPVKTVTARGPGAARPQKFHVTFGG